MIEPGQIMLHHGAHRFWLRNAVTEAFVDDHLNFHAAIFQALPQFVRVGDRHAAIELAMLNQCGRLRIFHIRHRRSLLINQRVFRRIFAQIIDCERRDVGVVVVGRPVRDSRAHGDRREAIARGRQKRRDVAALAPAHANDFGLINPAFANQIIDS